MPVHPEQIRDQANDQGLPLVVVFCLVVRHGPPQVVVPAMAVNGPLVVVSFVF